jgi:excisionase family DNA binding protein
MAGAEAANVSLLDSLSDEAREELREFVQAEIAEALAQHEERRRWLTIAETATYLGCSVGAIRGRVERGTIPVKRNGSRTPLIDREALDRQIASG